MSDELKLDSVTKGAVLLLAQTAPRLAYALESIAVSLDASRPHAKFAREAQSLAQAAAEEMLSTLRRGLHGGSVARRSEFGLEIDSQLYTVRVEIQHLGVSR